MKISKEKIAIYEKIAERFVSKDEFKEWLSKPMLLGDKVIVTDSYYLVIMPKYANFDEANERIKDVYPKPKIHNKKIDISELKIALSKFSMVEDFDNIEETEDCQDCGGSGVVTWEYAHYEKEGECPVCDGEGTIEDIKKVPNGKMVYDEGESVNIFELPHTAYTISNLIWIMELLGVGYLEITNQTSLASYANIGEIELLFSRAVDTKTVYEIKEVNNENQI